jgi:hypothetical protein
MVADALSAVSSVLNTLVNVEYVFENALQYSHVEDVHMDKRLFIPSAEVMAANPYTTTLLDNQHLVSGYQDHLRQQLRTLQAELRDTHEYRLLRDWGYRCPWRKLYYYLDNEACGAETAKAINMIRTAFHRSERAHALFDVHPLLRGEEALKEEEECVICMNEYGESDLTMEYALSYSLTSVFVYHRTLPICSRRFMLNLAPFD